MATLFETAVSIIVTGRRDAERQLEQIEQRARRASTDARIDVSERGAETTFSKIQNVARFAKNLDGARANVNVSQSGAASTSAELQGVKRQADRVDGERVDIRVAKGAAAGFNNLSDSIQDTAGRIRAFGTIIPTISFPLLLGGLGAIPGPAAAAATSLAALTQRAGTGLAGAATIGGTALGGMAGGLRAYTAAAQAAVGGAMTVREELREKQNEQLQEQRLNILSTEATKDFNDQLDVTALALTRVQRVLGNKMLPAFTRMTALFTDRLPQLTPPLYRLVDGVTDVGEAFANTVLRGQGLDRLQNVLDFVADSGITAARGLSNLGRTGLAAIQPVIPAANRLNENLLGVTRRWREFAESARGQQTITRVVGNMERRMYELLGIVQDLGGGIRNMFDSMARQGVTDQAWQGLQNMARGFERATSRGSEFRAQLDGFNRSVRQNMPAITGLLGTVFRQFGRIADATLGMREEGQKLTVMQRTFKRLEPAVEAVATLLINSFRRFSPLIGPVIEETALFLDTLINKNPTVRAFTDTMLALLRGFNRLPQPVKSGVVALGSFFAILASFGIGLAVFKFFARFNPAMALLGGRATRSTGALRGLGSIFSKLGGWIGTALAPLKNLASRFMRVVRPLAGRAGLSTLLRIIGPRIAALAGPIGIAVAVIATLAQGFRAAYNRSDAFREAVNAVGRFLQRTFRAAVASVRRALDGLVGGFTGAADGGRKAEGVFARIGRTARRLLGGALDFARRKASQLVGWWRENVPLMQKTADTVFGGIRRLATAVFEGTARIVRTAWRSLTSWWDQNLPLMRKTAGITFGGIRANVGQAIEGAAAVVRRVWGALVGFWERNNEEIKAIARSAWNIIRRTVSTAVRILGNLITAAMHAINGDWGKAWDDIKRILELAWNNMRRNTADLLRIIGNLIKVAWNEARDRTERIWDSIRSSLQAIWRSIRTTITDIAQNLGRRIQDRWQSMRETARNIFSSIRDGIRDRVGAMRDRVLDIARNLGKALAQRWQQVRDTANRWYSRVRDGVRNRVSAMRDRVLNIAENLGRTVADRWQNMRNTAHRLFDSIRDGVSERVAGMRDRVTERFREMVNGARGYLGDLAIAIARVLDKIGMEGVAEGLRSRGKTLKQPIQTFARGGIARAKDGPGIVAEAGDDEAVVNLRRRTPESREALRTANRSPNAEANDAHHISADEGMRMGGFRPDKDLSESVRRGHRGAGATDGATHHDYYGYISEMVDDIRSAIPGITDNSYVNHYTSPRADEHSSVDFWGPDGRGDPISKSKGDAVADRVLSEHSGDLIDIIWDRRINTGGGWQPFGGLPHTGHPHVAWLARAGSKIVKGASNALSGVKDAAGNAYDSVKDFLSKTFEPPKVPGLGMLGDVGSSISNGLSSTVLDNARSWLTEQAEKLMGSSGEDVSASASQKEFARNMHGKAISRGLPGILPVMTAWVESKLKNLSGGDRDSIGLFQQRPSQGWGSPSQLKDPNYAINAFLDAAEPMKGRYGGESAGQLGKWAQAVQRSAYPDRYANEGYPAAQKILSQERTNEGGKGEADKSAGSGIMRGGMADGGLALREHYTRIAENNRPEAVIPLASQRAQQPIQQALGLGELREEVADLRADMREWRGEQTRELRSGPERTGAAVKGAVDRNLDADRATREAAARGQAKVTKAHNIRGGR